MDARLCRFLAMLHLSASLLRLTVHGATPLPQFSPTERELSHTLSEAALVVRVRQTGPIDRHEGAAVSFKVVDSWKASPKFYPSDLPKGFPNLRQNQFGFSFSEGQEIVIVYGRKNGGYEGVLAPIAALRIVDEKVVYYRDKGEDSRRDIPVGEFKRVTESYGIPLGYHF